MVWVLVFGGIAVFGMVVLICYAVWLWHKVTDLISEVEMISVRAGELSALLAKLDLTPLESAGSTVEHTTTPVDTDS